MQNQRNVYLFIVFTKSNKILFIYSETFSNLELEEYERESARPMEVEIPVSIPKPGRKQRKRHKHTYRTRAAHEEELQSQYEVRKDGLQSNSYT